MAKSSVPGLDSIRDLFSSAERAVLESTAGKALVAASRKQLEKTLVQARGLRDKWRDLHAAQSRKTKRAAAAAPAANARSREKADMFAAALERLQARLAELGLAAAPGKPAGRRVTKVARTAGHRTARAQIKGTLAATAAEITRSRTKPPARTATLTPAVVAATPIAPRSGATPVPRGGKKAGKRGRPAATTATVLAAGGQPLRFDAAKQRSAKASATAARLKLDGKVTRRGGHTLAAGKRRQAARDHRSR